MIGKKGQVSFPVYVHRKKAGHREFHSVQCLAPPKKAGKRDMPPFPFMLCKGRHLRQCRNMQRRSSLHEFADAGWSVLL